MRLLRIVLASGFVGALLSASLAQPVAATVAPPVAIHITVPATQGLLQSPCTYFNFHVDITGLTAGQTWGLRLSWERAGKAVSTESPSLSGTGPYSGQAPVTALCPFAFKHPPIPAATPGSYVVVAHLSYFVVSGGNGTSHDAYDRRATTLSWVKLRVTGSISAAPTMPHQRECLVLTGQFLYRPAGRITWLPVRGPIKLYWMPRGATKWTYVTSGATDARGDFMFKPTATVTGSWSVVFPGNARVNNLSLRADVPVVR